MPSFSVPAYQLHGDSLGPSWLKTCLPELPVKGSFQPKLSRIGVFCGNSPQTLRNARLFIILFVRNLGGGGGGLFAILAECSQFWLRPFYQKFKRKSLIFVVGRGGG